MAHGTWDTTPEHLQWVLRLSWRLYNEAPLRWKAKFSRGPVEPEVEGNRASEGATVAECAPAAAAGTAEAASAAESAAEAETAKAPAAAEATSAKAWAANADETLRSAALQAALQTTPGVGVREHAEAEAPTTTNAKAVWSCPHCGCSAQAEPGSLGVDAETQTVRLELQSSNHHGRDAVQDLWSFEGPANPPRIIRMPGPVFVMRVGDSICSRHCAQ